MLKGRKILSLPIVTKNSRKPIGEVKDIIYDPFESKVIGYLVDSGGWLKEGKGFLHTDMLRLEDDYLVISDESVIQKVSRLTEIKEAMEKHKDIRGLRVEHSDGHYVGVVQDIILDGITGAITGYEISDGVIQDLLDGRTTISIDEISVQKDRVVASQFDMEKGENL